MARYTAPLMLAKMVVFYGVERLDPEEICDIVKVLQEAGCDAYKLAKISFSGLILSDCSSMMDTAEDAIGVINREMRGRYENGKRLGFVPTSPVIQHSVDWANLLKKEG